MLDLGAPGASCGRFSITYSRLRFLFPLGGQIDFSKRLIMTLFSHARKKYNRWCLLSLENNSRQTNDGAKTLTIKKLKYVYTLLYPSNTLFIWFRLIVPKESKTLRLVYHCKRFWSFLIVAFIFTKFCPHRRVLGHPKMG